LASRWDNWIDWQPNEFAGFIDIHEGIARLLATKWICWIIGISEGYSGLWTSV